MRDAGAVGGRGRVEFSPAMVAGRVGSGAVRPGAGVATERTRTAGAAAGRSWLRALAAAGPWLRCLAGRCRASGSSHAGAHGPGGSGSSHPSPVPARPARRGGAGRFRRLAASLLVAIAVIAFGAPALAQTTVPAGWSLTPTGLAAGDQFRLLFLSSTTRAGSVTDIATYNTFIQTLAAAGHTDIQAYSSGFRVVGCTAAVDATANTSTTGTGVPIYWLNGTKVADTYADFYDGSWDDEANDKNESGTDGPDTSQTANYPLTGCDDDGTELFSGADSLALGTSYSFGSGLGRPNSSGSGHGPLSSLTATSNARPMYGLSAVFQVGIVDTTPPTLASATVSAFGTRITLVFSENIALPSDPGEEATFLAALAGAFSVTAAGETLSVDGVALGNQLNELILSVSTAAGQGQTVVLSYTDPTQGDDANALQDAAGNETASFTTGMNGVPAVTNTSTVDRTPPTLASATVSAFGTRITLVFSENIALPSDPGEEATFLAALAGAFSVTAAGETLSVDGVALGNQLNELILSVSTAAGQGQTVVLSYTDPTQGDDANALQDAAGNETASFTTGMNGVPAVTNTSTVDRTPPTLASATVSAFGTRITLVFSENIALPSDPGEEATFLAALAGAFSVTAAGETLSVDGVALGNQLNELILSVSTAAGQGQTVVLSYTDPTQGDDANALQDAAGNETASFTTGMNGVPVVTNNSTVAPPTLANAIPDQTATEGRAFSYAFPPNTFRVTSGGAPTYTATKSDGTALPTWLSFTDTTRTFSGTPQAADVRTVSVKVTATNQIGSVSDTFDIVVSGAPSGTAHCTSDPLELWCASLTVGSGTANVGFSNLYGSVAPNTFTYRTATIKAASLEHPSDGSGTLGFTIALSSGTTPTDGLLGPGLFTLEVGTGADRKVFSIDNPGTGTSFTFANHGLSWSAGDTVPVKLVGPLSRSAAWGVLLDAPSGTTGLLRARWQAPPVTTGVLAYHLRYRIVGSNASRPRFRRVNVDQREVIERYVDPGTTYEGQICTVTEINSRTPFWDTLGACSGWSRVRLAARSGANENDFTLSLELPDGSSSKATVAWNGTLRYRIRVSGVNDSSVLEFPTSTFGIAGTRLGPPGARIPEFNTFDSNTDSVFSYRSIARKFIVWDSPTSGYWERTQTVWTGAGANEPHVLELIDKPVRFFGSRMNRIGAPSSLCVEITDSLSNVTGACASPQVEVDPPVVTSTPSVSAAGPDRQWAEGETVEVTLAFSEAVEVDTANGVPSVGVGLGGTQAQSAGYLRGSGTAELVFGYTLVAGDGDHTVMAVTPDSLALNGGAIRSVATNADAVLGHNGTIVRGGVGRAPEGPSARFAGVPANHDGTTAFTVELHFSAEPEG